MEACSTGLWIASFFLEAILLIRAGQREFLSRFPLFYSYITYILSGSLITYLIYWLRPPLYATTFWFYFLVSLLVEFAVLLEISDHMFEPFPGIRRLGRFITLLISVTFLSLYVIPALLQPSPSSKAFLDFALRICLTKIFIVGALVSAAHYYRLRLGRNVAGLMRGFAIYLGIYIANLAAAGVLGKALYGNMLRIMNPLGSTLCLLVWTIAMWEVEPVRQSISKLNSPSGEDSEAMSYQLARFNNTLTRLLRK